MNLTASQCSGLAILAAPFIGLGIYTIISGGWKKALLFWGCILALTAVIGLGSFLLLNPTS